MSCDLHVYYRKKKTGKSTLIAWQETPRENSILLLLLLSLLLLLFLLLLVDSNLFIPQPINKTHTTKPSPLIRLLAEQQKKTSNPFHGFQKFNGEVTLR